MAKGSVVNPITGEVKYIVVMPSEGAIARDYTDEQLEKIEAEQRHEIDSKNAENRMLKVGTGIVREVRRKNKVFLHSV